MEKQSLEGSLTAVASGEGVVPASELPAAIKQIKSYSSCWVKNHGSLDPQSGGVCAIAKMDSACALVTFGQGIAPVSRVLGDTQAAVPK